MAARVTGLLGTSDASRTAGDARAPAGAAAAWCAQHPDGGECRCYASPASASQSLDELEFVRSACHAAQVGALDKLRTILSRTPGAVGSDGATGGSGYTPLHYAARAGQDAAIELLLSLGAPVNAVTRAGLATPLHRAAHMGHLGVVQRLLAAGADAMLQDADGETALHKAAAQGHAAVAAALLAAAPAAAGCADKRGRTPRQRATAAAAASAGVPWPPGQ